MASFRMELLLPERKENEVSHKTGRQGGECFERSHKVK